jgi:hypothetical protein
MNHELLLVVLALDVAGVVTVFVTIARARLRGGGVLRHAGSSPAASGVKRGSDGGYPGANRALSQPEPG